MILVGGRRSMIVCMMERKGLIEEVDHNIHICGYSEMRLRKELLAR